MITAAIGDFCETGSGGTPRRERAARYFHGGTIAWVKSGELRESTIAQTQEHITEAAFRETGLKLVPPGAILIAMYGATVGRLGILGISAATNQAVCHVLPDDARADRRYLFHALRYSVPSLIQLRVGGAQPNISQAIIRSLKIPLPSLAQQRRLAAILDGADAPRAKRGAALVQLDALAQSIFLEMFGDPASNPKGWPMLRLKDHASKIGSGSTPLGGEASYKQSGIALIRSMNVRDGSFDGNGLAFIDEGQAARLDGVVVEADDVLLNITGASVARVCRAPIEVLPARVNQHVSIIRPTRTFLPRYLEGYLLFPSVKQRLLRIAGAGATREAITKTEIERLEVMRPPEGLQGRFNDAVQRQDKFRRTQLVSQKELNALFASLQHRAFRGEL